MQHFIIENEIIKTDFLIQYKKDITSNNDHSGVNDIFEVFFSFKDLTQYIV